MTDVAEYIFHGGEPPADATGIGVDWLDLSTGISPFSYPFTPPSPESWRRLPRRLAETEALDAAAGYFGKGDRGDICFGPGSQALLQLLPDLLPSGAVAVLGPTYGEHGHRWAHAGHALREITELSELSDPSGACRYSVVVNPNSPTGAARGLPDLLSVAGRMAAQDGFLIVDEAFCDVAPELSLAREVGHPGLLILRSFGKFFGLAGLRLGFLLGPSEIIEAARVQIGPWPVNGPALAIAAQAYGDADWISGHRLVLAEQALRLQRLLAGFGDIVGGTDLFVLLQSGRVAEIFARLADARIHVRRFPDHKFWLRFGLPGDAASWRRLTAALG